MANLYSLCRNIPESIIKVQRENYLDECARRMEVRCTRQASAQDRRIGTANRIFAECKTARPQRRYRNKASREEMGTCPQIVYAVRTGEHSTCVCKGYANR